MSAVSFPDVDAFIITLLGPTSTDAASAVFMARSLSRLKDGGSTPLLVFHENNASTGQPTYAQGALARIKHAAARPVLSAEVHFGPDPTSSSDWKRPHGKGTGYKGRPLWGCEWTCARKTLARVWN